MSTHFFNGPSEGASLEVRDEVKVSQRFRSDQDIYVKTGLHDCIEGQYGVDKISIAQARVYGGIECKNPKSQR